MKVHPLPVEERVAAVPGVKIARVYVSQYPDMRLAEWDDPWVRARTARSVTGMSTTWLTKRRAVDNCRVSSALCRMR